MNDDELREALARLEHEQWMEWSQNLAHSEPISDARLDRWEDFWVPYDELEDEVKEHDREWADRVLEIVEEHDA